MPKFICSIYENRPQVCKEYPWNDGNDIFEDCIFFNKEDKSLRSMEEQLKISTPEEISEYCVGCGKCCQFQGVKCSMLLVKKDNISVDFCGEEVTKILD